MAKADITSESIHKKVSGYLFNRKSRDGWPKGQWFVKALGFNPDDLKHIEMLEKQIRFDSVTARFTRDTQWGPRFEQELSITGPNGKTIAGVRAAWQKDKNSGIISLMTLMPPKHR